MNHKTAPQVGRELLVNLGGVVVVADDPVILGRVEQVVRGIEAARRSQYAVQLVMISGRRRDWARAGIELSASGSLAASLVSGSVGRITGGPVVAGLISGNRERGGLRVDSEPFGLIDDGGEWVLRRGSTVAVVRRVVSPEGTVSDGGVDYVPAGLRVSVRARREARGLVRLVWSVSDRRIDGYVGAGYPVTSDSESGGSGVVRSAEWYLLSQLVGVEDSSSWFGWLGWSSERVDYVSQLWVHAVEIDGAGLGDGPPRRPLGAAAIPRPAASP